MPTWTRAFDSSDARAAIEARPRSPWREVLRRLRRSTSAVAGGIALVALILTAVAAPLLTPYEPLAVNPADRLLPPSLSHLFGTDVLGRDVATRILFGARISLLTGLISVTIAILIGVPLGLVSGFYGGLADRLLMRLVDLMLTFPGILLALVIIAILGPDLFNAMLAVGISASPTYGRVVRATVLAAKSQTYVEAARATGCTNARIMLRHILPNTVAPIIVLGTLGVAGAIIAAAALSYLGLGARPPEPEWGALLSEGRNYLRVAWWMTTFPGLAIMTAVLSINLLGDGLRDALDPWLRN
ncbi:MAG: ABC transporter permease [Armatimonadota bacterium]|nr:ABC transporter permease [Armatimonadota bacterium]MDR7422150.1 ABC transporter permease [Armatimonadota bacterium]MDR7495397.1 ABC transporter permease [Armatimonadota bacterium]MDR7511694.1 ABC transporter permease [Armatimonadota bacterium]